MDTVEEARDLALIRMAQYQNTVTKSFNKKVKAKTFMEGDWVLRRVSANTQEINVDKLGASWEGPYQIARIVGKGAYQLQTPSGEAIPRSWNASHLKIYHF